MEANAATGRKSSAARTSIWRRLHSAPEPHWFVRDVVLVVVVGVFLTGVQVVLDNQRSVHEERLENLRFVRGHSGVSQTAALPFNEIDLEGMNISGLSLAGGNFSSAHLRRAQARSTRVAVGEFKDADLRDSDFSLSYLRRSSFRNTNAKGASFRVADLSYSSFFDSAFDGADFYGAILDNVSLNDSDLSGAINLNAASMISICYTELAKWPEGFTPPPSSDVTKSCGQHHDPLPFTP